MAFPLLDPTPADPTLPGFVGMADVARQKAATLANQAAMIKNRYLAPMLQQKLAQTQSAIQAQQAGIPLTQASTAHMQETTRLQPLTTAIMAQNAMNKQLQMQQMAKRFGPAYQLRQRVMLMAPPARSAWIADNKQVWANTLAQTANEDAQSKSAMNLLTPELLKSAGLAAPGRPIPTNQGQMQQAVPVAQVPAMQPTDANSAAQGIPSPAQTQALASQNTQFSGSQKVANDIGRASELAANKDLTPGSMQTRQAAANTLESFINKPATQALMQKASQYQGMEGRLKEEWDKLVHPAQYSKTISSFKSQFLPLVGGSLKIMEGLGSTIPGLNAGLHYFKLAQNSVNSDPSAAMNYFHQGMNLLKQESDAINTAASPMYKVSRVLGANAPTSALAQGATSPTIPASVTNSKQFHAWMSTLTPAQQQSVIASQRGNR